MANRLERMVNVIKADFSNEKQFLNYITSLGAILALSGAALGYFSQEESKTIKDIGFAVYITGLSMISGRMMSYRKNKLA